MREREPRTRPNQLSSIKKGDLKDCSECRFDVNKECSLSFPNEIEVSEEIKGHCIYFCPRRIK